MIRNWLNVRIKKMQKNKQRGELYLLAKQARKRLKKNSYKEANILLVQNKISSFMTIPTKKEPSKITSILINSKDEILYQKVCQILARGNVLNPIGELIDQKVFSSLDTESKQKYIYNLADKYKELKIRYYREHPYNSVL